MFANVGPMAFAEGAVGIAQAAEAGGFESLWTVEHTVVPSGYESSYPYSKSGKMPGGEENDIPDPLIWLSFVAAATSTIRLGTGILILPQRNPVVLAKEVATLDRLSGGRVELGIGVGWLAEEFDAIGIPFDERGKRADDNIAAMRALWTQDKATYDGGFTSFTDAIARPQPTQDPLPITIGGHSTIAARRAGRIGNGFFPGRGNHEELAALFEVVRSTAVEHGRDPDAIELMVGAGGAVGQEAIDKIKALADLGVSRIVMPPLAYDVDGQRESFARYGDEVISRF